MKVPSERSARDSTPPKAAIWTQQVVELPPIMNQKASKSSMMFDDKAEGGERTIYKNSAFVFQNLDWD